ncbi:MAG: DNA polymerase I [Candidatus Saccharimonadales bacterium]
MERLVLIDGKSVFYRGYYAMSSGLSLRDGTPTNAVFGFASIAIEIIKQLEPDYVAVAWDIKGTSIAKRKGILPGYKATRKPAPPDFHAQIPLLRELLDAFGWPLYEIDNYEADDIMGTFAKEATARGVETCIVSGDYDMCQLIAPMTKVYITKVGGKDLTHYDDATFTEKYNVRVDQFVDYKALVGDTSDNIPGVRKIGPVAASKLLAQYNDLDGIYAHIDDLRGVQKTNLEDDKDIAYASKAVASIFTDAPIKIDWKEADINNTNLTQVASILEKFEFHSLTKRLPKHMQDEGVSHALTVNNLATMDIAEKSWPEQFMISGPVVIDLTDDELWLSTDRDSVYHAPVSDIDKNIWRTLEMTKIVGYDIKQLYHSLANLNITDVHFDDIHDIRQGAFLIDPLRRDRSLEGLIGGELTTQVERVAALWQTYDWQVESFKQISRVAEIARKFDFALIHTLYLIERRGVKIDKKLLAVMSRELEDEHKKLEQEMYTMAGYEFNIGSPAQLSEVLFTKIQLSTAGIKKGKTGFSTGQKELNKLRGQHPIIELIERTRELAKLKNTYVDTLPLQTDKNNRIHTTFNQDIASTGRLSSTDPNLQNIPVRTDLGRRIREAFVPEEGKLFVSADYSQFELRLAAVLADDKELINDFNNDVDIHTKTAALVYGIPMDSVTKAQRRDAKVINFGVLYGMSPHGLSVATGMSLNEAKKYIDHYFELRAPIRKFIDETLSKAKIDGYVETFYGRRRPTPDVNSSNFMVREGAMRQAANMPIQGTEADLMKLAMIQLEEKLAGIGEQILQIHDSVLVETPKENADKVAEILRTTMESIAPDLSVKLKVDVSIGKNWGEL